MVEMHNIFYRNVEHLIIIFVSLIVFILSFLNTNYIMNIYLLAELNQHILSFSGTLFGLLLTAYAILFGLIPSLSKDFAQSKTFGGANHHFFITIMASILIIIDSFLIYFITGYLKDILIYIQIGLLTYLILTSGLLVIYLYLIFRVTKRKV